MDLNNYLLVRYVIVALADQRRNLLNVIITMLTISTVILHVRILFNIIFTSTIAIQYE